MKADQLYSVEGHVAVVTGGANGLGFAYSRVNAAGRPSLLATLSEVPSELRGALFGINVTMASLGWLLAGSLGGWLIATGGFTAVGVFCAAMAVAGACLALVSAAGRARSTVQ